MKRRKKTFMAFYRVKDIIELLSLVIIYIEKAKLTYCTVCTTKVISVDEEIVKISISSLPI